MLGLIHDASELGDLLPDLIGHRSPLDAGGLGRFLGEGGGDEGRDDATAALAGMRQHVPGKVNPAALPGRVEHLADRRLDALVGVRHHQLDAAQAAASELAQELRPDQLGLGRADLHAENLAPAVTIDADGDDDGDRDDAAAAAAPQVSGVDPDVGPPRRVRGFRFEQYWR